MERVESITLLLQLASHDSDLLGFCVAVLELEDLCDDLQVLGQNSVGGLSQDYFYLLSKFARVLLYHEKVDDPITPRTETAQRLRIQILIGLKEQQCVLFFLQCMEMAP